MPDVVDMLPWALNYARLGYSVFPVGRNKHPLTSDGFYSATTNEDIIRRWWEHNPSANIAIYTHNICVVDIDGADNPWPQDPNLQYEMAICPMAISPRGGRHYYYCQPEGAIWTSNSSRIAPKVDIRANGGYILAAPSITDNGTYKWVEGMGLDCSPEKLPLPPEWLLNVIEDSSKNKQRLRISGAIHKGERNSLLFRLGCSMRRTGLEEQEILGALEVVNQTRCEPQIGQKELEKIAQSCCRYEPDEITSALVFGMEMVGKSYVISSVPPEAVKPFQHEDAGELPEELLRPPGLISDIMDLTLSTAPYPNPVLAFCGAITMMSFLTGRKVRHEGGLRGNIYLIALANSGSGKDWPRKVNAKIAAACNRLGCVIDRVASGEGLEDAIQTTPTILLQTDEIDGMIQSVSRSKDARYEMIMNQLLTLYSSSSSTYSKRIKAGTQAQQISQPHLTMFGTAVPEYYYGAMSSRMLSNGFFARCMVISAGKRGSGQQGSEIEIPKQIIEQAEWWTKFSPTGGNAHEVFPEPKVVPMTDMGRKAWEHYRAKADVQYALHEERGDNSAMSVWSRAGENMTKIAMLIACSKCRENPQIDDQIIEWAWAIASHTAKTMLFKSEQYVSEGQFDQHCKMALRAMVAAGGKISRSEILRRIKCSSRELDAVIKTLMERGEMEIVVCPSSGGRKTLIYQAPGDGVQAE